MNEFKIGDRVKSIDGLLGTVVVVDIHVGVRHDYSNRRFHHLDGACESGYGWWYFHHHLSKLKPAFKGNTK